VMRGASDQTSTAYQRMGFGHVSWNELQTSDADAGLAFYDKQFGIRKNGGMPMGEMGEYSFISNAESGDGTIGAIMGSFQNRPGWGFYFRVPEIQAARAKVLAGGGTVRQDPMQVPGGEWVINCTDPEGVHFGLVSPENRG